MSGLPNVTVIGWWDTDRYESSFILDDPVQGELNNTDYNLSGIGPVDVTSRVLSLSVSRGRSRQLDAYEAGSCSFTMLNLDREFDPYNEASTYAGNIVPAKRVQVFTGSVPIFDGLVEKWELDFDVSGFATVTVSASDRLAELAKRQISPIQLVDPDGEINIATPSALELILAGATASEQADRV